MEKNEQATKMKHIACVDDRLQIVSRSIPVPQEHEVLVKVAAFGVNRADLLQKQGKYPPPKGDSDILGLEAAGTVVDCSEGLKAQWLGKRVFALTAGGAYAEYVCIDAEQLMHIPDNASFTSAASIAEVYLTAYDAIVNKGSLEKGHTLLIHGGASGVGSAAIRLGKLLGAQVISTQSSEEKCQYALELGADVAVNYNNACFTNVMREQGLTANVIVDPVAGSYVNKNLQVAAMDCHCIYLALLGGRHADIDMAKLLAKRVSMHGSTLRNRSLNYKRQLVKRFWEMIGERVFDASMCVPIYRILKFEQVEQAHAILQNNENLGKVVVVI